MNEIRAVPQAGLWPSVWKLMRLRLVILLSGFRRAKTTRKIGIIFVGLLVLVFLAFVLFLSWVLLQFVRSPEFTRLVGDATPFLQSIPVLILAGVFLLVLLTSFGVLLQALYLAGDMDFLLTAPVPIRAVFVSKMLQAILPSFGLTALLGLPVLFGLGLAAGYAPLYYPLVIVMLAALALAAAGLSSLLVMAVVRIFPARRVAEVLGLAGAVSSFLCSQTWNFMEYGDMTAEDSAQLFALFNQFNNRFSPLSWPGVGLVAVGEGRWLAGLGFSMLTLGGASLIFFLALTAAERLYYSGWASLQGTPRRKKAARPSLSSDITAARSLTAWFDRLVTPQTRAIMVKDFRMLRRDLRNMSSLVMPLILGVIYAVMFFRRPVEVAGGQGNPLFDLIFENVSVYAQVGLSLFVGWSLVTHLAGIGFSQERHSYWVLKTAPVSTIQLLLAKFLVAFLPGLGLGWLFLTGIAVLQQANLQSVLYTLLVITFTLAGDAGLSLAFGVIGANFDWEDPRQMQRGASGCLGALFSFLNVPFSLLLFFGPPVALSLLQVPQVIGQLTGLLLGGVYTIGMTIVPLWLVRDRVPRLSEA